MGICEGAGDLLTSPERLRVPVPVFEDVNLDLDPTMYADAFDTLFSVLRMLLPRPKLALPSLCLRESPATVGVSAG